MKNIFAHTWIASSEQAGGINLKRFVLGTIAEAGVGFVPACPEDACGIVIPALGPAEILEAINLLNATIAALELRVDALENP